MTETVTNVPHEIKMRLAEIVWAGCSVLGLKLKITGGFDRKTPWFPYTRWCQRCRCG